MAVGQRNRRDVLAYGAAAFAGNRLVGVARAEPNVIRIGVQPSLSYTPIYVMKERALIEKHGKAAGILIHQPALVGKVRELGFTFVSLGSDGGAVRAGMQQSLATLRAK